MKSIINKLPIGTGSSGVGVDDRAKPILKLVAFLIGGYAVAWGVRRAFSNAKDSVAVSIPELTLPTISMPAIQGEFAIALLAVSLGVIYAVATKRGWRSDLRFLIQMVAIAMLTYVVGRAIGPKVWEVLPI